MRHDEEYVKKSMELYLSKLGEPFEIIEGEDPPDYYVILNNRKILFEVTCGVPMVNGKNGLENRTTNDLSLLRLCDELNIELGEKVNPHKTIDIHIDGPIINFDKFKKALKIKLQKIIEGSLPETFEHWTDVEIKGNNIEICIVDTSPERKRITGFIGAKYAIIDINFQVKLILIDRISEKENKTKKINGEEWVGEKWLAILNAFCLADKMNYLREINEIEYQHTFSKIFLIEEDHDVTELYSKQNFLITE